MMSLRSALATFAALALAVALVACGPVGPSSGNATKAPLPAPGSSQAGSNVGEVHGTLNAEYEQTLKGPDSTQEGSWSYEIAIRLAWSPGANGGTGAWVDDGSTYSLTGTTMRTQHVAVGSGSCDVVSEWGEKGSGAFGGDSQLITTGADGNARLQIGGSLAYVTKGTFDTCGTVTTDETATTRAFLPDWCESEEPLVAGPQPPVNVGRYFEWNCEQSTQDSTYRIVGKVWLVCAPQVSCPTWEAANTPPAN